MILEKEGLKVSIGSHLGKKIVIGSDHRGFELKEQLKDYLKQFSKEMVDIGCFSKERVDYPVYSAKIGELIAKDPLNSIGIGIAICGSGIGIGIPAAKFKGVYPARCLDEMDAVSSRKHNNSNLLTISAGKTDFERAKRIVVLWLTAKFYETMDEESYLRRFLETVRIEGKI